MRYLPANTAQAWIRRWTSFPALGSESAWSPCAGTVRGPAKRSAQSHNPSTGYRKKQLHHTMRRILNQVFFNRPTLKVAEELLGTVIVRRIGSREIALPITEVEAYDWPRDRASHASRGKTERNAPMFGDAGFWYVYLVYGMHWMLNIVIGFRDYPAAILIRAAGDVMGPGRVTKKL